MLCDTILMVCLLGVVPLVVILIFVVIDKTKLDTKTTSTTNKQNDICVNISDKELREAFIKEYINSDRCFWVKLKSLPKSFKIGNVHFDKGVNNTNRYQTFISYVTIDGKIYDNGNISIDRDWHYYFRTTNKDLTEYVLNNLDKVEEVKQ